MLEAQLKDRSNEIERLNANLSTIRTTVVSSEYDAMRYLALKEENLVLKEQIVLRDNRIQELEEGGLSSISHVSSHNQQ